MSTMTTLPRKTVAPDLPAPFPWFGGKSRVAPAVWERFGVVRNYVEPFFGSGAVLLGRPRPFEGPETVNDADGMLANFWRAVRADPQSVAHWADWPVNENDLHARHAWLVGRKDSIQARLEGDPDWFDARVAGWWCWGVCCWIGAGWCTGKGPWHVVEVDGERMLVKDGSDAGQGVNRKRPDLNGTGRGVNRRLPHLGDMGRGRLDDWLGALANRLSRVRVCCGDWSRVCGTSVVNGVHTKHGRAAAVFLDPPYSRHAGRANALYTHEDLDVATAVRAWAIEHGDDPRLRIALCGYEGEHDMPDSWECVAWKSKGGYASQSDGPGRSNATRERIWFSPHCVRP